MDLGLKNKVAIVTGASEGIGRATAAMLAEEGATVIICARRPDVLAKTEKALASKGRIEAYVLDVTDLKAYAALVTQTAAKHGRLDIIVNNAGATDFVPIDGMSDERWHAAFRLNVDAAFGSCRAAFPIMKKQGGGAIVNASSIMGERSQAGMSNYGASKAALEKFTKNAAVEGCPHNIWVNTVRLGSIRTDGFIEYEKQFPEQVEKIVRTIPLKRSATPDVVADEPQILPSQMNPACIWRILS